MGSNCIGIRLNLSDSLRKPDDSAHDFGIVRVAHVPD
jgi:hypothetical protein